MTTLKDREVEVYRLTSGIPEVKACPRCGTVALVHCWHEDTEELATEWMAPEAALDLMQDQIDECELKLIRLFRERDELKAEAAELKRLSEASE